MIGTSPKDLLDTLELMIHDVNAHIIDGKEILEYDKIKFHQFCKDLDKGEAITIEELDDLLNENK